MNSRSIVISAKTRNFSPSFSLPFALSLFDAVRFLLFCIPGRRRADFWPRLVLEARRGQRSGKRLSLRHCHTILPGPSLEHPCSPHSPGAFAPCTYAHLILFLFLSHPLPLCLYHARVTNRLSCFLECSIILPLCTYDNEFRFSWSPSGRFPRSISSLTNDRDSIRNIHLRFCFTLDFRCYSGLRHLLERGWVPLA